MSDMDTKIESMNGRVERLADLPESKNARCNLSWFRENLTGVKEEDADRFGPLHLRIFKAMTNRVELWKRITTGKDPWFEKVSEYPLA